MAPASTTFQLNGRGWGPNNVNGPPYWHHYLSPGSIAAIVLGVFFFLLLLGCIGLTYSSRFANRRSRSRSTRSYYTNTSYATQRGGAGGSSAAEGSYYYYYPTDYTNEETGGAGGADVSGWTATARNKAKTTSKRQKRAAAARAKMRYVASLASFSSVSSPSSSSASSSAPKAEPTSKGGVPKSVLSPTPSMTMASDTATITANHETKEEVSAVNSNLDNIHLKKMRKAKTYTRKNNRRR